MRVFLTLFLFFHCLAFGQDEVVFSPVGGNYPDLKSIAVDIPKAYSVYYTQDGTTPNKASTKVNGNIQINGDVALFFAIYKGDQAPIYTTHTYITSRQQNLPIFSIITDPVHLFDSLDGIYEMGCCAETELPFKGANFWKKIEKPIQVEFIENNKKVFSQAAGIKIFGGYSVSMPQKSFAIHARKKYGNNRFQYPLFPQLPFYEYKNFVLRNAGGDMQGAHIRDAYSTQLTKESGVAFQEYRPVVVYINGKYWGIYSLREKINEHFIHDHYGINKKDISIIRPPNVVKEGPKSALEDYQNLIRFIGSKEKLSKEDIAKVQQEIDIEDYLKYSIIQTYFGNSDAASNIRLYKDVNKKTPFKTVLFDLDMGLNIFDENKHKENSIQLFTSDLDTNIQYPTEYTLLLRQLLSNDSIKNQYINYFSDAINTYFKTEKAEKLLFEMTNEWSTEITHHRKRWNITELRYNRSIDRLQTFIQKRPDIILKHLKEYFDLGETFEVKINVGEGGKVKFNSIEISEKFSGQYFKNVPLYYEAIPDENYEFVGWKNNTSESTNQLLISTANTIEITPIFKAKPAPYYFNKIILSEINITQSKTTKYEDWIEIYNLSEDTLDLSHWILKDDKDHHSFKINKGTVILPHSYLILTKNKAKFIEEFGNDFYVIGDFPFGFNERKDKIRLYNEDGYLVLQFNTEELPLLTNKQNSWVRVNSDAINSFDQQWIEEVPQPGIKTYSHSGEKQANKSKYIGNLLIFIGIILSLLVLILFFINLANYIGRDIT